jgi:hypothetical protein
VVKSHIYKIYILNVTQYEITERLKL